LKSEERHDTANSLIKQVQNNDRKFAFYVHWTKSKASYLSRKLDKEREYTINFNVECSASNEQTMQAYFFGLKLDEILNKKLNKCLPLSARHNPSQLTNEQYLIRNECLNEAIFEAEEYHDLFDFATFTKVLVQKGWKLDTMYIDKGANRYQIEY